MQRARPTSPGRANLRADEVLAEEEQQPVAGRDEVVFFFFFSRAGV
jgi:hypothetical protein